KEKLTGELIISDYPNLEEINLSNHGLTSLIINNCPNLNSLNVRNNQLTKLELDAPDLEEIIAGQNELTTLDLREEIAELKRENKDLYQ
ncbi:9074_t:CDS:2, partial [Ambispora leptoticha]